MLGLRSVLTFALLLGVALVLALLGRSDAVAASAAWWLWFVTAANVASIALMAHFGRLEGLRLRDIFFVSRATWRGDLVWALIFLVGSVVLAMPPGMYLASLLWGNANYPNDLLFQALPILAVYPLLLLMPTTQALAELSIYWGYVAPRLRAFGMGRWAVIGIVGFVLSIQHMFFAFQLDWRYNLWLALKFLPFALWTGYIVDRRPSSLPYLMGLHFLIDASLPVLLLLVLKGMALS
jgi:membrane protease YdiL (CAAX protease family)